MHADISMKTEANLVSVGRKLTSLKLKDNMQTTVPSP